jgi:DNA-nicking Smr family endonuclease
MKRPPSIAHPELSAPQRRKRTLSEEERTLWEGVARQTRPLRKKHGSAKPKPVSPEPEMHLDARPPVLQRSHPPASRPKAVKPTMPPLAPLGRRERSRLSRGRKEIEARLDLHGMTQFRAHRALSGFLQRAHQDGLTFVLVITGKGGLGAESGRGILRRQVPQWLSHPEFRTLVVGFEEAHLGHGGEGALYVRIRRLKS